MFRRTSRSLSSLIGWWGGNQAKPPMKKHKEQEGASAGDNKNQQDGFLGLVHTNQSPT